MKQSTTKRKKIILVVLAALGIAVALCCCLPSGCAVTDSTMRQVGLLPTRTPRPTTTPTATPTATPLPSPTFSATATQTATASPTVTESPSATPTVPTPETTPTPDRVAAQVVDVVDGDTIKVEMDGQLYTVRYIGIDCPETRHPDRPVEWMGPEATQANRQLVAGQTVYLEKDVSETDQYGRLLRYVFLADETFVNAELVRQGYAQVSTYPPDVRYESMFLELQREAREAERGLWGATPVPEITPSSTPLPPPSPTPLPATQPPAPACDCSGNIYNCGDFSTHAAAQSCFEYCISQGVGDIHRLDGDNDGIACESLP